MKINDIEGFATKDGSFVIITHSDNGIIRKNNQTIYLGVGIWSWFNAPTGIMATDYVSSYSFQFTDEIVHPLDEKFIPNTIARTEDIPTDTHINELINIALGVIENGTY